MHVICPGRGWGNFSWFEKPGKSEVDP